MNLDQSVPQAIRLEDYRPPDFRTETVELSFDIHDGETIVDSVLTVKRERADADSIFLDGSDLELLEVCLDGQVLGSNGYSLEAEGIRIFGLSEHAEIKIRTRIFPERNTALEGLYKSSQMYCTQCEAQGFRKITYYQDRPDVLARFTTRVTADADLYPTLLSNGNLIAEETRDGRKSVTWSDPFPKPSYLFALVAGNLSVLEDEFTTLSGRTVPLRIYSEPHNIGQCDYAMDALKRSMRWDEEVYGREYDLDIFMIVAVEDFNMGAMENKGLNIFNTSCVLASPDTATDAAYLRVEAVVAHEYFHNWSGNRVTCRDWFQLSLKEGFTVFRDAQFSGDMNSAAVKRIEDVQFLRSVQFAEDAGPLAHPVRPASYIEISNFYTTTIYEKGAEIVRMYHTMLGPEKFRAASDLYFERFDGAAATTDDFAAAMSEVGDKDLAQFKRWYEQAGTPRLSVSESFAEGELVLTIDQDCPPTPQQPEKAPFHMPVELGLLTEGGAPVSIFELAVDTEAEVTPLRAGESLMVELREGQTRLTFGYLEDKPVVSFLRGFSAPVRVDYPRAEQELAFLAQHDIDGFVRWDSLQSLWVDFFRGTGSTDMVVVVGQLAEQALALDRPEEMQLAAQMLVVPDINYLLEALDEFQLDELLDRRERVLAELASQNSDVWRGIYDRFRSRDPYVADALGMARRGLANIGLAYLSRNLKDATLTSVISDHYSNADNLTDRRAALSVAVNHESLPQAFKSELLEDFYAKWSHEALVIDLWFSLQAQSRLTDLDRLRALEAHESFNPKNPNRARALFGVFGMHNHERFHEADGAGYRYLADAIIALDELNPQLASRLTTPLSRWRRYDSARTQLMRGELERIAGTEGMSKDLYEIVTKSLG